MSGYLECMREEGGKGLTQYVFPRPSGGPQPGPPLPGCAVSPEEAASSDSVETSCGLPPSTIPSLFWQEREGGREGGSM